MWFFYHISQTNDLWKKYFLWDNQINLLCYSFSTIRFFHSFFPPIRIRNTLTNFMKNPNAEKQTAIITNSHSVISIFLTFCFNSLLLAIHNHTFFQKKKTNSFCFTNDIMKYVVARHQVRH